MMSEAADDYESGFTAAVAGRPLVGDIDASYSGSFITGWTAGNRRVRR